MTGVADIIGDAARVENSACARRLSAIAELYERQVIPVQDGYGRDTWRIDPWEGGNPVGVAGHCPWVSEH